MFSGPSFFSASMNGISAFWPEKNHSKISAKSKGANGPSSPAAGENSREHPSSSTHILAGIIATKEQTNHLYSQSCLCALRKVNSISQRL